jgi:drug/metabolite transporter superfamily protein YnfA
VYAAYGGVRHHEPAVGWAIDGNQPDNHDWLTIVAAGVPVIYFVPRHA